MTINVLMYTIWLTILHIHKTFTHISAYRIDNMVIKFHHPGFCDVVSVGAWEAAIGSRQPSVRKSHQNKPFIEIFSDWRFLHTWRSRPHLCSSCDPPRSRTQRTDYSWSPDADRVVGGTLFQRFHFLSRDVARGWFADYPLWAVNRCCL